jgi:hypothetical protein
MSLLAGEENCLTKNIQDIDLNEKKTKNLYAPRVAYKKKLKKNSAIAILLFKSFQS